MLKRIEIRILIIGLLLIIIGSLFTMFNLRRKDNNEENEIKKYECYVDEITCRTSVTGGVRARKTIYKYSVVTYINEKRVEINYARTGKKGQDVKVKEKYKEGDKIIVYEYQNRYTLNENELRITTGKNGVFSMVVLFGFMICSVSIIIMIVNSVGTKNKQ